MDEYARWLASMLNQAVNPFSRDAGGRPWTQRGVPGLVRGMVENIQRHPVTFAVDMTPVVGDAKALGYDLPMALREGRTGLAALAAASVLPGVPNLRAGGETIRSAALRVGPDVVEAPTHAEAWIYMTPQQRAAFGGERTIETLDRAGPEAVEGFVTSSGRFVDREEAARLVGQDGGQLAADDMGLTYSDRPDVPEGHRIVEQRDGSFVVWKIPRLGRPPYKEVARANSWDAAYSRAFGQ